MHNSSGISMHCSTPHMNPASSHSKGRRHRPDFCCIFCRCTVKFINPKCERRQFLAKSTRSIESRRLEPSPVSDVAHHTERPAAAVGTSGRPGGRLRIMITERHPETIPSFSFSIADTTQSSGRAAAFDPQPRWTRSSDVTRRVNYRQPVFQSPLPVADGTDEPDHRGLATYDSSHARMRGAGLLQSL